MTKMKLRLGVAKDEVCVKHGPKNVTEFKFEDDTEFSGMTKIEACNGCEQEEKDFWAAPHRSNLHDILISFSLGRITNRHAMKLIEEEMS